MEERAVRLLLVEDNEALVDAVSRSLTKLDHAVDVLREGDAADEVLAEQAYDLVILDLNLPGMDGLEVLRNLRRRGSDMPVLILTARSDVDARVTGLDQGADDYLTKPFALEELEARVRAMLRRRDGTAKSAVVTHGVLSFDTQSRTCRIEDRDVDLTPRERSLLEVLLRRCGKVVSKEQIAESIFSFDDEASLSAIEIYVHRLRKKLDHPGVTIRTVRGLGYLLEAR